MANCPICDIEILEDYLWCKDCSSDCENSTELLKNVQKFVSDRVAEILKGKK